MAPVVAQARRTRRALTLGVAAAGIAGSALVAGCAAGGAAPGPATEGAASPAPPLRSGTVLQVLNWPAADVARAQQEVIDQFVAQHPGLTVQLGPVAQTLYWDKLAAQLAAGTPPDVCWTNPQNFERLAAGGALLDLGPLVARDRVDLGYFWPGAVQRYAYRGSPHAMTSNFDGRALFFNKTLFDKAGVPYPPAEHKDASWTWGRFLSAAQALTRAADGGWGACVPTSYMNTAPWVWSAGGDVLNKERTACVVTSPETVDAFQFLADLVHRHGVAPPPEALRAQGEVALFQTGRVAILQGHAANVADGRKVTGFDWDVAPLPRGKAGPVTGANGPGWIIPAAGQHHEEAWALVRFLTTPAAQTRIALAGGGFGSKRVAEAVYRELPPPPKNARVFVDGMAYTRPDRFTANWPDLERAMNEELALLWAGRRPARETMAAIKARVDPLLQPPG